MSQGVFLAGASGAIGQRLTPLLRSAGYSVWGTTRSETKAGALRALGAEPVVVNVYDAGALSRAVAAAKPDVVIHQLTDLPKDLDPQQMPDALVRNARMREQGTRNLVTAARAVGARRLIAQSLAWLYAPGPEPHVESDPLDVRATGERGITMRGVVALEELTLNSPPLQGIVLRYGRLYGPGTHAATASDLMPIHVDAAAQAALLAVEHGPAGIFNIAEPNPHVSTEKARRELGWNADFRLAA